MVTIDLINVIILVCESVVDRRTYCVAGGRGGLCVGELLFEGRKFRVKGIGPDVNKVRGCHGEFAVKRVEVFFEGLDFTFHLVKFEVVFIEFVMHGCV